MCSSGMELVSQRAFQEMLIKCDEESAEATRNGKCPDCGAALHSANYQRRPPRLRIASELRGRFCRRLSLCCAREGCRHRATPPSLRFLGPKHYLAVTIVLVTAIRCGATPERVQKLTEMTGVSRQTVQRWKTWWQKMLPKTDCWRTIQGRLATPVKYDQLPQSLLDRIDGSLQDRLLSLLRLIGPMTCIHRKRKISYTLA